MKKRPRYEYLMLIGFAKDCAQGSLNDLGKSGWRVIAADIYRGDYLLERTK